MEVLESKKLTKKFKDFTAVDNISFSLKEREILGLLGVNGAGKTTTLQMLLGVLTPTSGEVNYFGKNLKNNKEEILEQVNFSSTYINLPWNLTVEENFNFISYLYKIKDRKERLSKILKMFDLKDLWKKQMYQLSAGQITRVNLAKSFINFPKVLLLDEPTASLDPETAKYIREFLLSERKEFNVSIIITSHNMSEVEDICDRVIFINQGKIIANDTPEELAKTVEIAHVKLLIKDGLKRAIGYCNDKNTPYIIDNRYIIVDLKEIDIPEFLRDLMSKKIFYTEISIDRPTLEDYFLKIVSKDK